MTQLYNVDSPITREQRNNLNATFIDIQNRLSNLRYQISILTGSSDLEEIINRIEQTITNANNATINTQQALNELTTALNQLETALNNSNEATSEAREAATDANESIQNAQNFINQLGNARTYDNSVTYQKNNVVEYNGSSYMAVQQTIGNLPPSLPEKRNDYWQLLAQRGVDGNGSVISVNNISPDINGNVFLTPGNINAASEENLETLRRELDTHLNDIESNGIRLAKSIDVFRYNPIDLYEGRIWIIWPLKLEETFTGENTSRGYANRFDIYNNPSTIGAIVETSSDYISNNRLALLVRPTVNRNFVIQDLISKTSVELPKTLGQKRYFEFKVLLDQNTIENQFGIGFSTDNSQPSDGGIWGNPNGDAIRLHYSYSASFPSSYVAIQQKTAGDLVRLTDHSLITGNEFIVGLELINTGVNNYSLTWFENDIQMAQATNVQLEYDTIYPYFYNQSTSTISQIVLIDDFRVW